MQSSGSSLPSRQFTISTLGWSQKPREFRKRPASLGIQSNKTTAKAMFLARGANPDPHFPSGTSIASSKSRKGTKRSLSASSNDSPSKSEYYAWWNAKGRRSSATLYQDDHTQLPTAPDLMVPPSKENRPPLRPRRSSNSRSPLRSTLLRKSAAGPPPLTLARIGSSSPISLKKMFHPHSIADGAAAPTARTKTGRNTSDSAEETASPKWWKPVRAPSLAPAPTMQRVPSKISALAEASATASPKSVGNFPVSQRKAAPLKWWKPVRGPSLRQVPAPDRNQFD
jgi:hypothetical protein